MDTAKLPSIIGLIPARAGSKRIPNKNIQVLEGHPLIAYSISSAILSGVFSAVVVSTDSSEYARIAEYYGAEIPFLRPNELAGDTSPDVEWVEHMLRGLHEIGREYACFSILRPTSPFRQPETIQRAWSEFCQEEGVDSLRAVEKCQQHPGKMWIVKGKRMVPVLPFSTDGQPWHSRQYPSLPEVYVQNASLEIAHSRVVFEQHTIAGDVVMPFLTRGFEGMDVNHPSDWILARENIRVNGAVLPQIAVAPYLK